jgi:hypothetical protein
MKNKPLLIAIIYASIYIGVTLFFYFTGRFELFNMVYVMSMALVIPLVVLTIKIQRDTVYNGIISGREAAKEGMKFVIYSAIILIIFQAVFYYAGWKDFKMESIPSDFRERVRRLSDTDRATWTEERIQKAIAIELANVTVFKEITGVFFRLVIAGLFSSFLAGLFMKRK